MPRDKNMAKVEKSRELPAAERGEDQNRELLMFRKRAVQ
jgi:hypothetical protein